jgi:hypothetical protein
MRLAPVLFLMVSAACGRYSNDATVDAGDAAVERNDGAIFSADASLKDAAISRDASTEAVQAFDGGPFDAGAPSLCTEFTGPAVNVVFQNTRSDIVRFVWRHHPDDGGPGCEEVYYAKVFPGSSIGQSTYVDHVFAVYRESDGAFVKEYRVTGAGTLLIP